MIIGIASLMFTPGFAQFGDGDFILGGSFVIKSDGEKTDDGTNVTKDPKYFEFSVGPHLHYMLTDNISIGGEIFFDRMRTTTYVYPAPDDEVKEKDTQIGIGYGPIARYWWQIGEKKKFGLFAEAGFSHSYHSGKDETYDYINDAVISVDTDRMNRISLHVLPGMFYAPAECFFFEVSFGGFGLWYNNEITKVEGTDTKIKDSYFKVGGDLDELFFGSTAIGINVVF